MHKSLVFGDAFLAQGLHYTGTAMLEKKRILSKLLL